MTETKIKEYKKLFKDMPSNSAFHVMQFLFNSEYYKISDIEEKLELVAYALSQCIR